MTTAGTSALATAHGVIDGIHRNSSYMRTPSLPPTSSCLTQFLALMLAIPYLSDTGAAVAVEFSNFSGREANEDVTSFLCHELSSDTGASYELCALADFHFDIVNNGAKRNVDQRKTVTRLDIDIVSGYNRIANGYSVRRENVSFLSIYVAQ